jgi:endo-1,4-beta-xylanase
VAGLQVHITEMDVRLPLTNGVPSAADVAAQAQTYARILTVCLQNPGCTAVQTWGLTDKYSWIPGSFPGFGAALPFDAAYQPKSAVAAMLNAFTSVPPALSSSALVNAASYTGGASGFAAALTTSSIPRWPV